MTVDSGSIYRYINMQSKNISLPLREHNRKKEWQENKGCKTFTIKLARIKLNVEHWIIRVHVTFTCKKKNFLKLMKCGANLWQTS